jgi:hypothetical protein
MVVAQHGKNRYLRKSANLCVDFPGTGEDEITFHRGDLIVVIAKDEGFGDGWWTVISPSPLYFPTHAYLPVFAL